MSTAITIAVVAFAACLGLAYWLARRSRERAAFAAVMIAPLAAAGAFVALAALPHAAATESTSTAPSPAAAAAPAAKASAGVATEADVLRRNAEELRLARRFDEARDAYDKLVKATPNDVDAWADLADAQAAASGGDLKPAAAAIDRALAIDPNHLKALWLKASLELQQQHYTNAGQLWEHLLAQLAPDSNDARIVRENLDETRALASKQGAGR